MRLLHTALLCAICLTVGAAAGALAQAPKRATDLAFAGAGVFDGIAHGPAQWTRWIWPARLDGPIAAPRNHKVVFENDKIVLLEVTIRPGETEKLHGHMRPSVFAIDGIQPRGEDTGGNGERRPLRARGLANAAFPQCIAMGPQAPHQFHNLDSFPQHFYRLEFKKMDGQDMARATYGRGSQ